MKKKFRINPEARRAAYARSRGICERCGQNEAVHLHHLTYERMTRERPEDLEHICLNCHCAAHPTKAQGIFVWELERRAEMPEQTFDHESEERLKETIDGGYLEPAWNLGEYTSSGYDTKELELEDLWRADEKVSELCHISEVISSNLPARPGPRQAVQRKLEETA
jgi:hypothetical protein